MFTMDLNQEPDQDQDEEEMGKREENDQEREETGIDIYKREKEARIQAMKRKRQEEEALHGKTRKVVRPALASVAPASGASSGPPAAGIYELAREASGRGGLPDGWLNCPPAGTPIDRIIPSKAPLGEGFKGLIEPGKRYTPQQVIRMQNINKRQVGLVIDLTNTSRYYKEQDWRCLNVQYIKLPCRGRDEVPDNDTVNKVVYELMRFFSEGNKGNGPGKYVIVHCTHGHNRTGFVIVHYLMRTQGGLVAEKLQKFAEARPPGIYKEDYIQSLFDHYHQKRPEQVVCPSTPEWKSAAVDLNGDAPVGEDEEEGAPPPPMDPTIGRAPTGGILTIDDVLGDAVLDEHQLQMQKAVCWCLNTNAGRSMNFPGSQPVSLSRKNLQLLRERYYYVTWKADGTRYMMLILLDGVYLIDRNFRFRRVCLRFPRMAPGGRGLTSEVHQLTLLDGEMVVDTVPAGPQKGQQARRYLVYDLMALHGQSLVNVPFETRWKMINDEIIQARKLDAATNQWYLYEKEELKVRRKDFWPLSTTKKLLRDVIPNQISHESDGLILQGWDDKYVTRTHEGLLKWKYAHMNSVDFTLKATPEGKLVLLLQEKGRLRQLEGARIVFPGGEDPVSMEGRVVECSWNGEKQQWEFMRIRYDKEIPNAWNTYQKVMDSITDNITEEDLLQEIESVASLPMYTERQPPPKPAMHAKSAQRQPLSSPPPRKDVQAEGRAHG